MSKQVFIEQVKCVLLTTNDGHKAEPAEHSTLRFKEYCKLNLLDGVDGLVKVVGIRGNVWLVWGFRVNLVNLLNGVVGLVKVDGVVGLAKVVGVVGEDGLVGLV